MAYWLIIKIIKGYQIFLSPFMGRHCRFKPTCSEYYCLALKKHSFFKGTALTFWRIIRCNPFYKGGVDYP